MISLDDHPPPDPSSSDYHHHHHHQDLKINSDDLDPKSPPDADLDETNNPLPNFSIRDYVFGLRSKNVACNWPFSQKSLQLCLKRGVKNLLPPFENLDLLRDNSSVTSRLPDEEILTSFNGVKSTRESVSTNSSGSKGDKESESQVQEDLPHTKSKSTIKKGRLVMKLNPSVEPVEEVVPNSFIVSETMASKVCPVCKTFSSSSNTTLNAHIDQCLSGESSMKWTANPKVMVKHRVKPRKTRLMVDIYETARHCTVEELDRRNGTSWATNSSFPAQEFQFQGEEDKEEPRETTINVPEVADHEGDVYIDNNGTKVRILSSVPKAGSSDNNGARKLLKGVKGSNIMMGKKNNNVLKQKYLKLSLNDRKSSSSKRHRVANSEIGDGEEDVVINGESCRKDGQGKEPMKDQVHMKMDDNLAIIRPPWACSKRTSLARKLEIRHATKGLPVESDKSSSGSGSRTPPSSSDNNNNMASSQSFKKMRTSSPLMVELSSQVLTKPGSKQFRKENGVDIRSKHSKFSSLRKNLSVPAAKSNLKRKFSAIKMKSSDRCLSNVKNIVGPSQDSSNDQSRSMEEDTSAGKNEDRSITSKSLNGESSAGIETATDDVESVRSETLTDREQVHINPAPETSFMGLTNFSKLESQPDNKFDSLYEDQLCTTNRAPDGKNIFGNDVENDTDLEKNAAFFQEVDPIPIPGPPGSFLPSPGGDMVSEELHSSLTTTSRVQSGENQHHHDPNDRDSMSNSPISTVSNPSLARSDSKSSEKLSARSTSVQDDIKIDATYNKSFQVSSFKNDQPCCCSRKEGASLQTVASNHQESSLLRKRTVESIKIPSNLNFRSDMFSLSAPDQTMIFPTAKKSPAGSTKLPVYSDCDSAASPSKPVLRLMGKDLTVVQTDDDISSSSSHQFKPPQSSTMSSQQYPGQQFRTVQNGYPQSLVIFSQYQNGSEYAHPPSNMRSHVNLGPVHGGFMSSVDRYGHGGPHLGPTMARTHTHLVHNGLDTQVVRERNMHNGASKPVKEIIIIDDSPENEADERVKRNRAPSSLLQMNPLYTMYQSQASTHPYGGSQDFHGAGGSSPDFRGGGFQASLGNGNLGKWNYNPASGSSSMMHPNSIGSPSPSPSSSHFRSSTAYYPPSYP